MPYKIKFVDFWPGFDPKANHFTRSLDGVVDCEFGDKPDILFFSSFGRENELFPDAIKVFYTGENIRANRFACDYSINFDHVDSARHFRLPLYDMYSPIPPAPVAKDKFCSIVVSNPKSHLRLKFFHKLHERKPVDSGGRVENNVGGPVESKSDFISRYRFNIAFENSSYPGYSTEKLFEAKNAGCIPIYWGDPRISDEFNPDGFIDLARFASWDDCIDHILEVESNPELLERYQRTPLFRAGNSPIETRAEGFKRFLKKIFAEGTPRWKSVRLSRWAAPLYRVHTRKTDLAAFSHWPEMRGIKSGAGF